MEYQEYELEDFLADPEFRDWVLKPDTTSHFFWKKWLAANPSKKNMVLTAKEIILSLEFHAQDDIELIYREELLQSVLGDQSINLKRRKANRRSAWLNAAASILLLLSFAVGNHYGTSTNLKYTSVPVKQLVKENLKGQKSRIKLPDGSTVYLNYNSRISYASKFKNKREIYLEGEAFFEVAKDSTRPFLVNSSGLVTRALGTAFNVKAEKGKKVEVGLVEGKISVGPSFGEKQAEIIDDTGGKATYDATKGEIEISAYDDMDFYKWTKRVLVFKAASFDEIVETLENWYDVEIKVHNLNRRITYTGEFPSESLESVLERIAFVEQFSFEIDEDNERAITVRFK
ncbi:FecR domain-containing protein [Muricauda sp. 2012CJ35-5]|uniref:FecR domain-containing protein n=1 Tax=Flagellimonas spongiicola TaxID=2942208 RepID=A0ABT0PSP4_9FLAO|nr:FecR family protein [Allomuricauda spongiicola]MCL6273757.1 FecR domain-containing protein [Allomuricauda spongiicola]